ncbi:hypothetical protein ACFL6C_05930 [Myxococcota bacterium]
MRVRGPKQVVLDIQLALKRAPLEFIRVIDVLVAPLAVVIEVVQLF